MERKYEYDEMPPGWIRAFGKLLLDDIYDQVEADGLEDFHILQMKEKFGFLRVYCSPTTEAIERIIDAYSHISEHVCVVCGKLDVYIIDFGWICPMCSDCYGNTSYHAFRREYESVIVDDDCEIPKNYTVLRTRYDAEHNTFHDEAITYDITPYVLKVKKYAEERN